MLMFRDQSVAKHVFLRNGFKERLPANGCILFYRTCGRGLEGEKSGLAM